MSLLSPPPAGAPSGPTYPKVAFVFRRSLGVLVGCVPQSSLTMTQANPATLPAKSALPNMSSSGISAMEPFSRNINPNGTENRETAVNHGTNLRIGLIRTTPLM